ncbi:MAG: DNA polymerase IV, partial [Deltaproteobacteria bacterium]
MIPQGFKLRERAVLHFNVADFAVAVERVADCCLRDRPLIIAPLKAPRAVVYDMSEEAYCEGVRKGMPLRQATRICRGAELLSPQVPLYQKAMQAFFKELQGYSPLIESGQADGHFFVDVTGTHRLYGPAPDVG